MFPLVFSEEFMSKSSLIQSCSTLFLCCYRDPGPESEAGPGPEGKIDPAPGSETDPGPGSETDPHPDPGDATDPNPERETAPDPDLKSETDPGLEGETDPDPGLEGETDPDPERETGTGSIMTEDAMLGKTSKIKIRFISTLNRYQHKTYTQFFTNDYQGAVKT